MRRSSPPVRENRPVWWDDTNTRAMLICRISDPPGGHEGERPGRRLCTETKSRLLTRRRIGSSFATTTGRSTGRRSTASRLDGRSVQFDLKKPFDVLAKMRGDQGWRPYVDEFLTALMEA